MKIFYFLTRVFLITVFTCSFLFAQEIPNNSFENWTDGNPDDWWTGEAPQSDAVTQTSDAWEGSSAALMTVLDEGSIPALSTSDGGKLFPVSERYGSFGGYYKLNPISIENLIVCVAIFSGSTQVGFGLVWLFAATTWTEFNVPIQYFRGETPDSALIVIKLAPIISTGATAIVDYLTFGVPTDVEPINGLPEEYSLKQNYPNPFNPSTKIEYSIPSESFVELKVYDVLGNEVASLVNEQQQAGVYRADFNAKNLPSGMYFARITANEFTQVVKMTLLK